MGTSAPLSLGAGFLSIAGMFQGFANFNDWYMGKPTISRNGAELFSDMQRETQKGSWSPQGIESPQLTPVNSPRVSF